jgi:predicted acetyltransferase
VPELLAPCADVRASFCAALAEFRAEGRHQDLDPEALVQPRAFTDYAEQLRARATMPPDGRVPETVLWWVESDTYLGRVSIRHVLNEGLARRGGHIGYEVRPSARRRRHGTRMLAATLPRARALGIGPALVTCDAENVASRRIIESAGGRLQDELDGELRFWVPTAA